MDVPHCDDLAQDNIEWIGEEIAEKFTSAAADCSKLNDSSAKKDLSVVYTPLFGSGRDFVLDALEKDGFSQVHLVKKQAGSMGSSLNSESRIRKSRKCFASLSGRLYGEHEIL